jgi:hypothetical protein
VTAIFLLLLAVTSLYAFGVVNLFMLPKLIYLYARLAWLDARNVCSRWREWPSLARAMWSVFFGPKPRCWHEGCGRPLAKWDPRYGFACAFHWSEFCEQVREFCDGD